MKDLLNLPIDQLGNEETACFSWATAPLLIEGLACLEAWGFTYKTHLVWDKKALGMGSWFRTRHEILLIGVRQKTKAFHCQFPSILVEARKKHSAKPAQQYDYIEKACPAGTYLELFARTPREGWEQTGLELDGRDVREFIHDICHK